VALWQIFPECFSIASPALYSLLRHRRQRIPLTDSIVKKKKKNTQMKTFPTAEPVSNCCNLRYANRWHVVDKGKAEVTKRVISNIRTVTIRGTCQPGGLTAKYFKRGDRSKSGIQATWWLHYKPIKDNTLLPTSFTNFCSTQKADSHIACRAHAETMPLPCHAVPLRV
jgi:hypothetical protein